MNGSQTVLTADDDTSSGAVADATHAVDPRLPAGLALARPGSGTRSS